MTDTTSPTLAPAAGAARPVAPAVSVILTSWNAALTIEQALGSLPVGREVAWECVVVDDASSDGTAAVVERLAAADDRIRLIALERNGGVSAARNRGLAEARGEWLAFLDADDRIRPGGLVRLYRTAIERDALAVIGQRVWTDGQRTWISRLYDNPDIRQPGRKSIATSPGLLYYLATTAKLFHRSLAAGLEFEGRVLGDQPWTACALLRAGDRIEVIADDVYDWIRPVQGDGVQTITTGKAVTVENGVAAVLVATGALPKVRAQAEQSIADPQVRRAFETAYAERLIGADIGRIVVRESRRALPDLARLYRAVGGFLAVVPEHALAASKGLTPSILVPPLRAWNRIPISARFAYGRILRHYPPRRGAAPAARRRRRRALRLAALALRLPLRRVGVPLAVRILKAAWPR